MSDNIIGRRMLLGAGALALAVPSSKAEALPASGAPSIRAPAERLSEFKNVKTYGAVGNGSNDDTKAIQAAVNSTSGAGRGTIYFPVWTYRITAPITFEPANLNIAFLGEPGALITGNFASALLRRSVNSPIGGVHVIENLRFVNGHRSGKGVMFHSCVGAKVVNCVFGGPGGTNNGIAIETYNSQSITVDTCGITGWGVGVMAGNATMVLDCDITGCTNGIRHQNVGLTVLGGRYEVNTIAIKVGYDQNDNVFQSSGFDISGLSMEANQTAIQVGAGAAGKISACSISGGVRMAYGLRLLSPQDVLVAGVSVGGSQGYSGAGIAIENPRRTVLMGVASYSPRAWLLPSSQAQLTFLQTNKP